MAINEAWIWVRDSNTIRHGYRDTTNAKKVGYGDTRCDDINMGVFTHVIYIMRYACDI